MVVFAWRVDAVAFWVTESVVTGNLCNVQLDGTSGDKSWAASAVQLGVQLAYSIFS